MRRAYLTGALEQQGGWMSMEVVPGGQRRIDRVLDPGFTEGVDRLGLPAV